MSTLKATAYLRFELAPTFVQSIRQGYEPLGVIRWFGRWRQYVFEPEPGTLFNPDCMDAISGVIRDLMAARRASLPTTEEA